MLGRVRAAVVPIAAAGDDRVAEAIKRDGRLLVAPQQDVDFVNDAIGLLHARHSTRGAENLRSAALHFAASGWMEH